ncbi:MAG: LysR family transcriptional regulator [Ginsengibacter sp.]
MKYILPVDTCRHFTKAAEACFVIQPSLSMMIQNLEEELDVKNFDRSRQPVVPTTAGEAVIKQAKIILQEAERMKIIIGELKG